MGSLLLLAASLSLLALLSARLPATIVLLFLWGVAVWSTWPALQTHLHNRAPHLTGQLLALNASFDFLGSAAGAGVGGIVVTVLPIWTLGWFGGAFAFSAFLCFLFSGMSE